MSITIEQVVEATPEVRALIDELNHVLGVAYEPHQRHGLSVDQLFQPNLRFFLARRDGRALGCGGVAIFDDYAEVKRMYTRPAARRRESRTLSCVGSRTKRVRPEKPPCASRPAFISAKRLISMSAWGFDGDMRSAPTQRCQTSTLRRASSLKNSLNDRPWLRCHLRPLFEA